MQDGHQSLDAVIRDWPETAREAVETTIKKYGQPNEYSASQVIWHNNRPWKRTVVSREEVAHDFPSHHMDVLEQFIAYRVPTDMYDKLAEYDGSVIVERTKGVMSARCAGEEMNFVAINLAHDIVIGRHNVESAREEYVRLYQAYQDGETLPYAQGFQFELPQEKTADPDVELIPSAS